ncbi:MAG: hypothetical protein HZB26_03720 [Candidatus Hydrogenedentes bacterium]|nr:hypothetical protein [Candidatus Hydrogenedentota bacterium]
MITGKRGEVNECGCGKSNNRNYTALRPVSPPEVKGYQAIVSRRYSITRLARNDLGKRTGDTGSDFVARAA